jgi:hypothetical protein
MPGNPGVMFWARYGGAMIVVYVPLGAIPSVNLNVRLEHTARH